MRVRRGREGEREICKVTKFDIRVRHFGRDFISVTAATAPRKHYAILLNLPATCASSSTIACNDAFRPITLLRTRSQPPAAARSYRLIHKPTPRSATLTLCPCVRVGVYTTAIIARRRRRHPTEFENPICGGHTRSNLIKTPSFPSNRIPPLVRPITFAPKTRVLKSKYNSQRMHNTSITCHYHHNIIGFSHRNIRRYLLICRFWFC